MRAAAAEAKIVTDLLRFGQRAVNLGVQRAVLVEPEQGGAIFVRAAF